MSKDEIVAANEGLSAKDWQGPDDEANPHNWSSLKKFYHLLIPTAIAFLCPLASSIYTPAINNVAEEFNVSREVALLPFVLYLLGLAFGPVIAAPSSETFGRKYVYLIGVPVFGLFTLGAGFAQSITALVICRFFAGCFASPGLSIGTGTVADILEPQKRGFAMAALVACVQMGPAVGPVIGGYLVEANLSWRWTQWVVLFALAAVLIITLGMSETYKKVILANRAKKLGIEGPVRDSMHVFLRRTVFRPLHMLFTETIVTLFDIYVAVNFGLLNAFFAAFPLVFRQVYGFSPGAVGLTFLGQAVGTLVGFFIIIAIDKFYYKPRAKEAKLPPEQRLWIAMVGAPMITISMFWFGWTARSNIHWLSPVAAEGLFSCGNILIFTCTSLYFTDSYGALYGASAWSSNTFARYLGAMAFPLFADQMYRRLGVGWASSLLGFVTLLLLPVPFAFYIWGPQLRKNSNYAPDE